VRDDDNVATDDSTSQNTFAGCFLRIKHFSRSGKLPDTFVYPCRFYHTTVLSNVTFQYGQAAVFAVSVFQITDTSGCTVFIQFLIIHTLRAEYEVKSISGCARIFFDSLFTYVRTCNGILINSLCQRHSVYPANRRVHQTSFGQFVHDCNNSTGTVHILNVILLCVRSYFAKARSLAGKHINVVHLEVDSRFMGNSQQVKNRIGRTTHRNIQSHGIQKSLASGNATRKHALVPLFIIFHRIIHNQLSSIFEKLRTVFMRGYNGPVSGKSQADGFVQAVHRICCKHTGTTSAGRTSVLLDIGNFLVTHTLVGRLNHRVDQIQMLTIPFTRLHRTTRHKYSRYIQTHRRHQHPRSDLVTITDTYHRVCLMSIHHIFHTVCDDITGRKRVKHSIMPHSYTVVDSDCIEFRSEAPQLFDLRFHQLTDLMQMHVSRHKLCE